MLSRFIVTWHDSPLEFASVFASSSHYWQPLMIVLQKFPPADFPPICWWIWPFRPVRGFPSRTGDVRAVASGSVLARLRVDWRRVRRAQRLTALTLSRSSCRPATRANVVVLPLLPVSTGPGMSALRSKFSSSGGSSRSHSNRRVAPVFMSRRTRVSLVSPDSTRPNGSVWSPWPGAGHEAKAAFHQCPGARAVRRQRPSSTTIAFIWGCSLRRSPTGRFEAFRSQSFLAEPSSLRIGSGPGGGRSRCRPPPSGMTPERGPFLQRPAALQSTH